MPLEEIFNLTHPSISHPEPAVEDKRTWRAHKKNATKDVASPLELTDSPKKPEWTALDIMTSYALKKGWVTAKAGRPDINRAGNASEFILQLFCENASRIGLHKTIP